MFRKPLLMTLVVVVGLAGGCSKQEEGPDPAAVAYDALRSAWNETESAEAKVALAADYLARYPDTKNSGRMASSIVYYQGHEMKDPQGAWDVVSVALAQIKDPERRFEVGMEALNLADSVDVPLDIATLAIDLGAVRPLTFDENEQVAVTALDLGEWTVADEHALGALELATPEQVRADSPDREFTEDQVAMRVRLRQASALTYDGWALFNMGDLELAMNRFAAADGVGSVTYLGVPNTPLYRYWGRAALAQGDVDRAIELLSMETVFGEDGSAAEPFLREAYVAKNGSEDKFDEFLWSSRSQMAKVADNFELLDYQGNPRSLSETNGKVTLLAFWFPT
jgi:tetratricopeptide (TPR) repeat protein